MLDSSNAGLLLSQEQEHQVTSAETNQCGKEDGETNPTPRGLSICILL